MFDRVLLVNGLSLQPNDQITPQIGIGYLARALSGQNISCRGFDFSKSPSLKNLVKEIHAFNPDLIGFHLMSFNYLSQFRIIGELKTLFPRIKIIVGGPHASIFSEEILKNNSFIDFCCSLEGEEVITELATGRSPKVIEGLSYRDGELIFQNKSRPLIKNLDRLPFPTYDGFNIDSYPFKIIGIATSRGCPYKCIYCPVQAAIGCQYRARSPENVFDEISYWYKRGFREIWIQDDNFTLIRARVEKILDLILSAGFKDLKIALPNGIRSDRVDLPLLRRMKQAGFFNVAFGVEAGNDRILANLKKGEKIAQIRMAIEAALSAGIRVSLFFLVGSPGESEKDVEDSFALTKSYPVSEAKFYNLIPFPGTELYDYLERNNLLLYEPKYYLNKIDHFSNEPIFYTPEMDVETRKSVLKKSKIVRKESRQNYIRSVLPKFLRFIPQQLYFLLEFLYLVNKRLLK